MTTSVTETTIPLATAVAVTDDALTVELTDGRSIAVPLAWYPRLIARGEGIHWPDVDEDISVSSLIAGRPSAESAASLQRWLAGRKR